MQLAKGSQAVKLENHIAWGWTKGDWGIRKLVNRNWLEQRLRKEWSCWERGKCRGHLWCKPLEKGYLEFCSDQLEGAGASGSQSHPSLLPQSSAPSQHWSTFSSREFQEQDRKWNVRQGLVVKFQEKTKIIPFFQAFLGTQVRIRTET